MVSLFSFSECVPRRSAEAEGNDLSTNCMHDPKVWRKLTPPTHVADLIRSNEKLSGTILIDMDNTLNDWDSQFRWLMGRFHPDLKLIEPARRQSYTIEHNYPSEYKDAICTLTSLKGFWSTMPVARGAVQALNEMLALGIDVRIVSTPDDQYTGRCAHEKFEWLETHFGPEWKSRLILTSDKTLIRGTCLIDDKPTAMNGVSKPEWKLIVFCQPYNMNVRAAGTLHAWDDWYNTLVPHLNRKSAG